MASNPSPEVLAEVERTRLGVPVEAGGLRLYRIAGEKIHVCEGLKFQAGGVDTALRRAQISGRVEIGGKIQDHFADIYDEACDSIIETVALDAKSYGALKNRWARCKVERIDDA